MAETSTIEWTEATWNVITGCSMVSDGCTNCYAMQLAGTRLKNHPSRQGLTRELSSGRHVWTGEVRFNEEWLDQPLRWKRPRRVFVCAHGDLFHESVPDEWIDRVVEIIYQSPQHTFQTLTKRPERMYDYISRNAWLTNDPRPNWWLGVSCENQETADERIPLLLQTPAAVRWVSAEPLLGPIDFTKVPGFNRVGMSLDGWWVVVGGESGPHARPMHPDWARSLRDQCKAAGVPFFFKQWGEWAPDCFCHNDRPHPTTPRPEPGKLGCMFRCGKHAAGRLLDGQEHNEYPHINQEEHHA